jgi:hypothetical protein
MFLDVREVPGVIEVLIGKHGADYPALARLESCNQLDPVALSA